MLREPGTSQEKESVVDITLEELFDASRIQTKPAFYKAILYFPVALILLLARLIAGIFGVLILSVLPRASQKRSAILKGICKILGLVIEVDAKLDDTAKLLVSNHVSLLDRLVVNVMVPCSTITSDFQVTRINSLSFWNDVDYRYSRDLSDDEIWAFQRCIEGSPLRLLHFPESATTNGKIGLLKFHPGVFSLNAAVQPVLIHVSLSSFMAFSSSVLGSSAWADVLWSFILPSTLYKVKTLPSMEKLPNESSVDFSKRVQQAMASAMNLEPTIYTSSDKIELSKRLQTSERVGSQRITSQSYVPSTGVHSSVLLSCDQLSSHPQQKLTMNTAAENFGKSPKERMASYKDRRAKLLQAARQKYLEKHPI